ncbi:hypothetical protein H0H93_000363 [Arthromyces matolae]|nr:hypothetical protein H0H93_000363 [Arthromyces matolae]
MHLFCRHARFISTRVRHSRSSLLLEKLQQETDDPLWRFLVAMRHSVNFRAGRVLVPDYDRWKPLANMGGLAKAVEAMEGKPGPLWLAMYLLAFKIRAHDDAYPAAFDLAYAHLPFAPRQFRGPLLILTAGALSRFDLLLPIRRIVDEFLNADLASHSELYFNLFIQALTVTPSETTEIAQAIVKLLRRMDARKLKLSKETYDLLLNDKLVNIHLAHYLRHHMTRNNVVPTTAQLEAYLRIFAKKGTAEEASDIHSAIHHRVVTPHDLNHEDAILLATQRNQAEYPLDRTNKLLLSVRADPSLAQDYLEKLLNPAFNLQPKTFSLKSLDLNKSQPFIIPKHSHPDIHAFTSALTALVADEQVSAQVLVNTFEKARDVRDLRPNEVAYTVLMNGLYKRKDYLTPDPRALMAVEAPAIATRKTPDDEESWVGLNVGLPKWKEGVDTWEPPEWEELLIKRKRRVSGNPEETAQLHIIERIWEEEEDIVSKVPADEGITEYWDSYHPSIIPTSEAFLHYILLLGLTGRASEIARVLAWMRHLKITPSRSTLGASLALWGEVSGRALLIETIVRRRKEKKQKLAATQKSEEIVDEPPWMRGPLGAYARDIVELADEEKKERVAADLEAPEEYQKLVDWLCEWVPLHLMPGPRSLATWTRNIWRLREGGVWEAEEAVSETQHIEERVDFR